MKFLRNKRLYIANNCVIVTAAGMLAALTFLLHGSALQGHWRVDDPIVLLNVVEHPDALGYFFSPAQWQSLSVPFFTPWLALDYWLDQHLFGLSPVAFYAHHLVVVWFAALLTFVLLIRYVGWFWAGLATCLFLIGSPTVVVSQQLQARHYATGLVFAILSILFWLQARRTGRGHLLGLAALSYLAAMLNKEIFAPLPLVLFFLDSATLKDRLRVMPLFFATATLYVTWRATMLGKFIGGYNSFNEAGNVATSLVTLPRVFFGEGWYPLAGSFILLLAASLLLRRLSWQAVTTLCAATVALSLPFLGIQVSPAIINLRFAFLPWWGACVLLAVGLRGAYCEAGVATERLNRLQGTGRYIALLAGLIFLFVSAAKSLEAARAHSTLAEEFDVQGRFLWNRDNTVSYIPVGHVLEVIQFQYAMPALKMATLHASAPTAIPFTESARILAANSPIYLYDSNCHCMRKEPALAQDENPQTALLEDVSIGRPKDGVAWHFTVPTDTFCYLVFLDMNMAGALPCTGQIFWAPAWLRGRLRFFARTANGHWDFTPPLVFPEDGQELKWPGLIPRSSVQERGDK